MGYGFNIHIPLFYILTQYMKRISFLLIILSFTLYAFAQSETPIPLTLAAPGTYNDSSELSGPGEELIYYFSYATDDYNGAYIYLHLISDQVDNKYFPSAGDYEINFSGAPKSILAGYKTDLYYGSYIVPVVNGYSRGICFLDSGTVSVAGNADNCTITMQFYASDRNQYYLQYTGTIETYHHDTIPYMFESIEESTVNFTADSCEIYKFPQYNEFDIYLNNISDNLIVHLAGNIPSDDNIYTTLNVSQENDDETPGVIWRSRGMNNGTLYPPFLASYSGNYMTTDSLYFFVDGSVTVAKNSDGTTSVTGTLISFHGTEVNISFQGNVSSAAEEVTESNLLIHTEGNTLYIDDETASDYSLFDAVGHLVYQGNRKSLTISVPGVYIVRCNNSVQKIVIR